MNSRVVVVMVRVVAAPDDTLLNVHVATLVVSVYILELGKVQSFRD